MNRFKERFQAHREARKVEKQVDKLWIEAHETQYQIYEAKRHLKCLEEHYVNVVRQLRRLQDDTSQ